MRTEEKNIRMRNRALSGARLLPALIAGCFVCGPVWANPTGAQVVNGKVTINSSGNVVTITNTPGAIINWLSFSINAGQVTQFLQQNSSSSVLNRIIGQNPSQIFGTLESNGRVYLINPNGILFGAGSQVNVGGLVASSLNISNADFSAGKNNFNSVGPGSASVINQGSITTAAGGNIYLIAPQVQNSGVLTSPQGEIVLAAGHSVQLMDGADPAIQVLISAPTDKAVNLGQVIAEGGKIGILGALVNQSGVANANSAVVGQHGEIVFKSSQTTMLSGDSQTTAMGTGNNSGGTIELTGPQVGIVDNAQVNASGQQGGGKVMVGGDFHGTNPLVENASAVYIGSAAGIKADAIQSGNGGEVAVWSDNVTRMYGTISAQGGAQGGNGGYVETSSKNYLDFRGLVNITASHGSAGTLLLDPYDIVIDSSSNTYSGNITCSGCPGGSSVTFTNVGPATPSVVGSGYLATQLATGDVTVSTVALGGYIAVNSAVSWNSNHMLTLASTGDISINAAISGYTGAGKLALTTSAGNITEGVGGYINVGELSAVASTGNVTLNSASNFASTLAGSAGGSAGFQFTSGSNDIVVGTANGITGISSAGAVTLSAPAASISTVPGATIAAPSLTLLAANGIGTQVVPLSTSVGSVSATNGGSAGGNGGDIVISNTGTPFTVAGITELASPVAGGIYLISDNAMTVSGAISNNTFGNIGLQAAAGMAINAPVSTPGNTIALITSAGNLTENSSGSISANTLAATAGTGSISLTAAGNAFNTVAAAASTGIALTDTASVNVTEVPTVGTFSTPTYMAPPNAGLNSTSGNIGLQSGGSIFIGAQITAPGVVALGAAGGDITQGGSITAGALSASASGTVTLTQDNVISGGNVAGSSGSGSFNFSDTAGFQIGSVAPVGSVAAQNGISASGQLVSLTSGGAIGSGGGSITAATLQLNATTDIGTQDTPLNTAVNTLDISQANNVFINNSGTGNLNVTEIRGAGVVNVSTAGSLTVPVSDAGVNFTGATITLVSAGDMSTGNGNGFSAAGGTGAITLMAGFTEAPGATPVSNLSLATLTQGGAFNGSTIDLWANSYRDFSGTAVYSSTPNYHPGPIPISIYVTGTSVAGKIYDGTTLATLSGGTLVGIPADDLAGITFTQGGNFISKNAGTSIAVLGNDVLTLAPGLAGDFVLVQPTGLAATISPVVLTVSGQTAANKIYDGTTTATLSAGILNGVIAADSNSIVLNQSGNFASPNVGSDITVTAADSLSGLGASNYALMQPVGLVANIVAPVTTSTPNLYITPLLTSGLTNMVGTSSTTTPSNSNTGATNNGAPQKLYCN